MNFPSIRIEGAILSPDILEKLEDAPGQRPSDFGFAASVKVKDEIARAWADAQDYWRIFQRKLETMRADSPATTETRNNWMVPLLGLLGYQLEYQSRGVELNAKLYAISHRATNRGHTPVHIIGCREPAGLDRKPEKAALRMSAHAMLQEYLNLRDELYGLVTNGRILRLLRDSSRLIKLSYLEFDLDRIFSDGLFADFAVLYRLLHASRLPAAADAAAESLLERYHQDSLDSGARIRDGLSRAVTRAILDFANGFLARPKNSALRAAICAGELAPGAYYQNLLRLIYRLLFLMVIEERDLIFAPKTDITGREVYDGCYSLRRLRHLSEKRYLADRRRHDLWLSLLATFRLFEANGPGHRLGIAPLAGDLFRPDAIGMLGGCTLGNDVLLGCLRSLSLYQHPGNGQLIRVNYAALNVEEFGSVYEGLLEYEPVFLGPDNPGGSTPPTSLTPTSLTPNIEFAFAQGDERANTGSHYTPDDLVQPLIRHSLDHLIAERLSDVEQTAKSEWRMVEEKHRRAFLAHANQGLSRSGGLETGQGDRESGVSPDQNISERGAVWDDIPDSAGGSLDSGEHRRGMGTTLSGGVHSLSAHSQRQPDRTGNPPNGERGRGSVFGECHPAGSARDGDPRQATAGFGAKPEFSEGRLASLWASTPFATRHSLLASQALLSLRVADISCGSGHILLAAARRIATELAIVRTGEEQPSPTAFRTAVRDVIRECIYGVDINPLAVELCKVALWLEAHNPGSTLNFLDHHIKCGNAIVGFVRRDELKRGIPDEAFAAMPGDEKEVASVFRKRNKTERTTRQGTLDYTAEIEEQFDALPRKYREISRLPDCTPADYDTKRKRYLEYTQNGPDWLRLTQIAAMPIAQFYLPKTTENKTKLITDADFRRYWTGERHPQGEATDAAWAMSHSKRFFHWFLEFPDIIERGGFDCILGNPPYLGGTHLSGTYGYPFCHYVKWEFAPTGLSDLVAYFFRRIFGLLRPEGFTAFITTNSIKDGDIRKDGLEQVLAQGGTLNMVVRGIKWPGRANLVVSLVSTHKGKWHGKRVLDGKDVPVITAYFEGHSDEGQPLLLPENANSIYEGSKLQGDGFLLSHEEAEHILAEDPRYHDVVSRAINGDELNNQPEQKPQRSVINFFDWSESQAQEYSAPFAIVEQHVRPERMLQNDAGAKKYWWRYLRPRNELYSLIRSLPHCFVTAATTKHLNFSALPTDYVFTHALKVFTTDRWDLYAVVQSTIHEVWARKYSGALKQDLRYSPSKCFDTFPFPEGQWQTPNFALAEIGERYHEHRRALMHQLWLGLTDIYNLFHTPDLTPARVAKVSKKTEREAEAGYQGILKLRRLHIELDQAVLAAYGWGESPNGVQTPLATPHSPLALHHGFHELEYLAENDRVRHTISPDARKEVLKRLLALNHHRAAQESSIAAAGGPSKKKRAKKTAVGNIPANLPDGSWERPDTSTASEEIAALAATLKEIGAPRPAREVRLITLLAMKPALLTPSLAVDEAALWRRLVGLEAEALLPGVVQFEPLADQAWGQAVRQLRGTGLLIENLDNQTWAPGQGLDGIETVGWPEGRVRMVMDVLRRRNAEDLIAALPTPIQEWINAEAA